MNTRTSQGCVFTLQFSFGYSGLLFFFADVDITSDFAFWFKHVCLKTKAPDSGAFTLSLFITSVIPGCPARARTWTFLNQNQACCQLHHRTILKRTAKLRKPFVETNNGYELLINANLRMLNAHFESNVKKSFNNVLHQIVQNRWIGRTLRIEIHDITFFIHYHVTRNASYLEVLACFRAPVAAW